MDYHNHLEMLTVLTVRSSNKAKHAVSELLKVAEDNYCEASTDLLRAEENALVDASALEVGVEGLVRVVSLDDDPVP